MQAKWSELEQLSLEERVQRTYFEGKAEGLSHSELVEKILELAGKEWRKAEKYIPSFFYPENDPRRDCSADNYGVAIDPISLLEIPADKLISFVDEGEKKWCFDIDSLAEYVRRSKAENPITRRPLPEAIVKQLQEYERSTKSVRVTFSDSIQRVSELEWSIDVIRGTPLVEVALDVLRAYSRGSILDKVVQYKVDFVLPEWNFETEIESDLKVRIKPGVSAGYLARLYDSTSKRQSLTSISDHIFYTLDKLLLQMTVIDFFLHYSKEAGMPGIFYATLFYRRGNTVVCFYDLLGNVSDYGKKMRDFLPSGLTLDDIFGIVAPAEFIARYRTPHDLFVYNSFSSKVQSAILRTFNFRLEEAIETRDAKTAKELFALHPAPYETRLALQVIQTFPPEEVRDILGEGFVNEHLITYGTEVIPKEIIRNGLYAQCLGFTGQEKKVVTAYFLGEDPELSPILQAKFVAMTNDGELFRKYESTLDYTSLYKFILEYQPDVVAEMLPEKRKVELSLAVGYTFDGMEIEVAFAVLEEFIKQGKVITGGGFSCIFLDVYANLPKPPMKYEDLEPLLLRLARSNRESFQNIFIELQFVVFDSERISDRLSQSSLTDIYCRLLKNRKVGRKLKVKTLAAYFDRFYIIERELPAEHVQKILQCFGFYNSIEVYEASKTKHYHLSFSDKAILEMATTDDRNFELAVEVGAISQDRLINASIYALDVMGTPDRLHNWERIFYYLNLESLRKLNRPFFVTLFATDLGRKRVTSRYLQLYLRNDRTAQRTLVRDVVDKKLPLETTGAISILGVLELLKYGAMVDLSGLCNLFEGVEITDDLRAEVLSYPYLAMLYRDKL